MQRDQYRVLGSNSLIGCARLYTYSEAQALYIHKKTTAPRIVYVQPMVMVEISKTKASRGHFEVGVQDQAQASQISTK